MNVLLDYFNQNRYIYNEMLYWNGDKEVKKILLWIFIVGVNYADWREFGYFFLFVTPSIGNDLDDGGYP